MSEAASHLDTLRALATALHDAGERLVPLFNNPTPEEKRLADEHIQLLTTLIPLASPALRASQLPAEDADALVRRIIANLNELKTADLASACTACSTLRYLGDMIQRRADLLWAYGEKAGAKNEGPQEALRPWVAEKLKGKQRRVMQLVLDGVCKLKDIAFDSGVGWEAPFDDCWNSLKREINEKLCRDRKPFILMRHDTEARLVSHRWPSRRSNEK